MFKFLNLLNLRIKIMFRHWSFWGVFILLSLIIGILVSQLNEKSVDGLKIPVGLVDEDDTRFSEYIIEEISNHGLLDVKVYNHKAGVEAIKNGEIEALCVIIEGAEKKIEENKLREMFQISYLEGNYFAVMLSDIFSGEFLDEICLRIASLYYYEGIKNVNPSHEVNKIYNQVYDEGKVVREDIRSDYYINIELNEGKVEVLEWYNQSIIVEKLTLGIIYIFVAFFILFAGMHILNDREQFTYRRICLSGISLIAINLTEFMSMIMSGVIIMIPLSVLSGHYKGAFLYILFINTLYVIGMSGFLYLLLHIINKSSFYILLGASIIITIGIVSGSFFSIDYSNPLIYKVAQLFPVFYSVRTYFDKAFIWEYSVYTSFYLAITFGLCLVIDQLKLRSRI